MHASVDTIGEATVARHGVDQPWRFRQPADPTPLPQVDLPAFAAEIQALRSELIADIGPADLTHLRKMEGWGRAATLLGYATAWIGVNPLAPLLLAMGNTARWTMVTHHVMHRGYDKLPQVPKRYHSRHYARGWRRFIDWLDWMHPAAWEHEHNQLHHFHTGEFDDPDLVEHNGWLLRLRGLPRIFKVVLAGLLMATWKLSYYAPNTWWAWTQAQRIRAQTSANSGASLPSTGRVWRLLFPGERVLLPLTRRALGFQLNCVLPYALVRFGLIPALFLPLGRWAWAAVLINSLIAEIVANVHAFVVIVPNHAGEDVYRFDEPCSNRAEFYLRQVVGSVNYPGGSDGSDFLMGYLNYQIEHHLWPDLPMLKYRQAAPRLQEICRRHGVPYVSESVFKRFGRLWPILLGDRNMLRAAPLMSSPNPSPCSMGEGSEHPSPVTRHPSPVTRHPSPVTRHPSPVNASKDVEAPRSVVPEEHGASSEDFRYIEINPEPRIADPQRELIEAQANGAGEKNQADLSALREARALVEDEGNRQAIVDGGRDQEAEQRARKPMHSEPGGQPGEDR